MRVRAKARSAGSHPSPRTHSAPGSTRHSWPTSPSTAPAESSPGSCTLLSWSDRRILVDCGLYQGGEELELRNWNPFPIFHPSSLTAVVVTHAHLDHTGLLPRLVAEGFSGPIYCTRPSKGLISLVLQDSAALQEEEVRYARKKGYSRHENPRPLIREEDARRTLKLLLRGALPRGARALPRRHLPLPGACRPSPGGRLHRDHRQGGDGERRTLALLGGRGPLRRADPERPRAAAGPARGPAPRIDLRRPPALSRGRRPKPWARSSRRPSPGVAWS